jgi:NAD(P)-dependent dehydrogenase (short-subunit alcohol dehydrogenase family)
MKSSDGSLVALITGVGGGIGSATARYFLNAGWRVVGTDRDPTRGPAELQHFVTADVTDERRIQDVLREVAAREGRLDALVNNAAIQLCKRLVDTTPEEWDAVMDANLRAAYLTTRHAYGLLRRRGGAIVNISSVHAVATSPGNAAYAASKAGLLALTRALGIELAPDGIRVNAVVPGAIDTPMLRAGLSRGQPSAPDIEQRVRALGERHALARVGRPEEVARAVFFLADPEQSSFVTGHALVVDGGATSRLSTE